MRNLRNQTGGITTQMDARTHENVLAIVEVLNGGCGHHHVFIVGYDSVAFSDSANECLHKALTGKLTSYEDRRTKSAAEILEPTFDIPPHLKRHERGDHGDE